MKQRIICKTLAVAVIILFLGLAIQPAIADISIKSDDSKLEKITIQVCNEDGIEDQIRYVTQQQADELEVLFNKFKLELNNALTIEETTKLYKNMFESLIKLDLLIEDSNIEKTKDLILNNIGFLERINYKINARTINQDVKNFLCLVSGWTSNTIFIGPIACVISSIGELMYMMHSILTYIRDYEYLGYDFKILIKLFEALTILYYLELPIIINQPTDNREYHFGSLIGIGGNKYNEHGGYDIWQGKGWIHTVGLNGIDKVDEGRFRGRADFFGRIFDPTNLYEYFPGVRGFIGYGYKLGDKRQHYYIGFAWYVNVFNYPHLSPNS